MVVNLLGLSPMKTTTPGGRVQRPPQYEEDEEHSSSSKKEEVVISLHELSSLAEEIYIVLISRMTFLTLLSLVLV